MSKIEELVERVERLLVRYQESQRTNALLMQQITTVAQERDTLRSRLIAARNRIDALIERLPASIEPDLVDLSTGPHEEPRP